MKLGKIEKINFKTSGESRALEKAEELFLKKEFITENDIREIAAQIAEEILNSPHADEKTLTIMDVLRPETILKKNASADQLRVTKEDIEEPLERLKKAILEHLSNKLSPESFNLVVNKLSDENNRLLELYGDKIFKQGFFKVFKGDAKEEWEEGHQNEEARLENLKKLYSLKERSPYIAYHALEAVMSGREVEEIQKKLNFETMEDMLRNNALNVAETFHMIAEIMKGNLFLIENGFVITDNSLKNIGIFNDKLGDNTTTKNQKSIAKIFDLDGLLELNQSISEGDILFSNRNYAPPEFGQRPVVIGEPQIVFELGNCLARALRFHEITISDELEDKFHMLSIKMRAHSPRDRISLVESIKELEQIIEQSKNLHL